MKNVVLVLLCLVCLSSFAQDKVGIEAGISLASLRGDGISDEKETLTSFNPSLFYEKEISTLFSIKGLVSYERKGYSFDPSLLNIVDPGDSNINFDGNLKFISNYLTIGTLAKVTFGRNIQIFINAGPFIGFNVDGDVENPSMFFEQENRSPASSTDFGLLSGLGVEKQLGKLSLHLEGRNSFGLANTLSKNLREFGDVQTISFYILTGISYNL